MYMPARELRDGSPREVLEFAYTGQAPTLAEEPEQEPGPDRRTSRISLWEHKYIYIYIYIERERSGISMIVIMVLILQC